MCDTFDTGKRLAIIVPYRDRPQQLARFATHVSDYFQRDKVDSAIDYRVVFVQQADDVPFNRGALRNAGFNYVREHCDYVCFHDVDYLPLWADYSYPDAPTRLIWYGADRTEDDTGNLRLRHAYNGFFGGVVAFRNEDFIRVNGYSNHYWAWGYEDSDLRVRCQAESFPIKYRDGTFQAMRHAHHGYRNPQGELNEDAQVNEARFNRLSKAYFRTGGHRSDGLNTLQAPVLDVRMLESTDRYTPRPVHTIIDVSMAEMYAQHLNAGES